MSVKPFDKLTPAGKRSRIARDVLAQLDAKKLIAKQRVYVEPSGLYGWWVVDSQNPVVLSEYENPCEVCALGSLLMCKVKYKNGFNTEQLHARRNITASLQDYFDVEQLNVIETAFEGRPEGSGIPSDYNDRKPPGEDPYYFGDYRKYYSLFSDAEDRLRDVMHNIIANRGTFVLHNPPRMTPAPKKSANQYTNASRS